MRSHFVVGAVSGSVSIIKAKNKKAESLKVKNKVLVTFEPLNIANMVMNTKEEIIKLNTKSARRIFLTSNKPPTTTKGSI